VTPSGRLCFKTVAIRTCWYIFVAIKCGGMFFFYETILALLFFFPLT